MNTIPKEHDDLTRINGIGEVRQKLLQELFGVYTFQDLAKLTVEEIQPALKAKGHAVSDETIKIWLAEARRIALTAGKMPHLPENSGIGDKQETTNREGKWETSAAFIVEFQEYCRVGNKERQRIKIHHVQSGQGKTWSSVNGQSLLAWMMAQSDAEREAGSKHSPESLTVLSEQRKLKDTKPLNIQIVGVNIYQPAEVNTPITFGQAAQLFSGSVRGNEPFALEASFNLDAMPKVNNKMPVQYQVSFGADNLSTGANIYLGTTQQNTLQKDRFSYAVRLDELTLPPGSYRLKVLVTLNTAPKILRFLEIPLLQVV